MVSTFFGDAVLSLCDGYFHVGAVLVAVDDSVADGDGYVVE